MKLHYRRTPTDEHSIAVDVVPHPEHPDLYRVTVGERVFELSSRLFQRAAVWKDGAELWVQYAGQEYRLYDASQRRPQAQPQAGDLRAPMAGKIIRVLVQPGEQVQAGALLLILEAMKMEQQITAPQAGVVTRLLCQEGDQVTAGTELLLLEPSTDETEETTGSQ
ncbi:MAG: acetyl-CoA carboxylase biotin carboxyl carrier protein subunit [Candidatus Tectimicrobiota bacterium]